MRQTLLFNDSWQFTKEGRTTPVTLPHTWNAEDGQTGPAPYYRDECLYTKRFAKPSYEEDQEVYLEFRGVNASAKVVLNGQTSHPHSHIDIIA